MRNTKHYLAQANVAYLKAPLDSEQLSGFTSRIDEINALAEHSPGFVWRLKDEANHEGRPLFTDSNVIVTISVWQNLTSLYNFVYKSTHAELFAQRKQWFEAWQARLDSSHMVLWWVPSQHTPSPFEAAQRLKLLQAQGPSPAAFTFKHPFPAPETV